MREAIRWALIGSALVHIALQALSAYETGRWAGRHAGALHEGSVDGSPSLTGCYLAIVAPVAPWWLWPVFALGLFWSGSWLAYGALSVASFVTWPSAMAGVPIVALSAVLGCWVAYGRLGDRWRGDSLDSLWLRLRTWRLLFFTLPAVLPWGRRPLGWDLRRYMTATGVEVCDNHAFCEPLEVVYEWGLIGGAAVVLAGALALGVLLGIPAVPGAADPGMRVALGTWLLTTLGSLTLRTWPFPAVATLLILGSLA